jgi:tRNA(Glu) U13 pseudouridine synthase TruD
VLRCTTFLSLFRGTVSPRGRFARAMYCAPAKACVSFMCVPAATPLSLMKLANPPSYRPLAVKPRNIRCLVVDDMRNVQHGDATLAPQTSIAREGVRRFRSPLNVILWESITPPPRSGIKTRGAIKNHRPCIAPWLFTVFLQFDLPFGSSPNSVLREIVKTRTVDSGAILAT